MLELFRTVFSPPRHLILLVVAAWLGLVLAERRAARHGVGKPDLDNLAFSALIGFLAGGRLSFVLQNVAAFSKSPLDVFSLNADLFDPVGAIAAALIIASVIIQRKSLRPWSALDALTPLFAVLAIGFGLSHLAAGTAFGIPTDVPWGIDLWNATRHPTQIYETLAAVLIFALIWLSRPAARSGVLFLTFCALTACSQLVNQAFRADSNLLANGLIREQVIAWISLAVIFALMEVRYGTDGSPRRRAGSRKAGDAGVKNKRGARPARART